MFEGESPHNYEQKCLCVLLLDVSGSMAGEAINQLNKGLKEFHEAVKNDLVASQRLEVCIITFESTIRCVQEPALVDNFKMPTLTTGGSTKMVDGMRTSMEMIENRKKWYKETGQNYYRPIIVLITDGEPDQDQDIDTLSKDVTQAIVDKKFVLYALGVHGYNQEKLKKIAPFPEPLPLAGYKFSEFFNWLSNSVSIITTSKQGDLTPLPSVSTWAQIEM